MKTFQHLFYATLLFCCVSVVAQTDPCANFAANFTVASSSSGLTVQFTNLSTGAYSGLIWLFGDGTQSNASSPSHTYTEAGAYQVCLVIESDLCSSETCKWIQLTAGGGTCNAQFNFEKEGLTVFFNANPSTANGTIIGWQWTYGDGTGSGSSGTPQTNHVYAAAGTYTVCLVIWTNNGCEDDYCQTITISSPPTPECNAQFNFEKEGLTVFFNANPSTANGTIIGWQWTYGDGTGSGSSGTPQTNHVYAAAGTYTVCLVIWTNNGCEDDYCQTITISSPPTPECNAQFNYDVAGSTAYLNANPSTANGAIIGWQWTYGDGTGSGSSGTPQTNHVYAAAGTYTVCLVIWTNNGCEDDYCQTVTITGAPTPTCNAQFNFEKEGLNVFFNANASTANAAITSWTWTFGDGGSSTAGAQVSHSYTTSGTYTVCLVIETANGCEDNYCATVMVSGTTPTPQCAAHFNFDVSGLNVYLNGSPSESNSTITSWSWTFGDGTGSPSPATVQTNHTYATAGTYLVCLTITTANGCTDDHCAEITVTAPITPECNAQFVFETEGFTAAFNGSSSAANADVVQWLWDFGNGNTATTMQATHVYSVVGTYNVCLTITTANGCQHTTCQEVVITGLTPQCNAQFIYETSGLNAYMNANPSTANGTIIGWQWNYGDGAGTGSAGAAQTNHTYAAAGTYNVCLTIWTANECESTYCSNITVIQPGGTPECNANFNFETDGATLWVNGNPSGANSAIIGWFWSFGNGATSEAGATTNHAYANPGVYEVCLTIFTANGCQSTYCRSVTIENPASGNKLNIPSNIVNTENLIVQIELMQAQVVKMYLSDLSGKQVMIQELPLPAGINTVDLLIGKQAPGAFFLSVVLENGGKLTKRFFCIN